ncbi:MAG TPA: hypothetical protein VN711_01715 [Candidatus Saccharimonadales bacterium]|nr:hypothetical protein [Candidatus Saccharimonadales bacterium]
MTGADRLPGNGPKVGATTEVKTQPEVAPEPFVRRCGFFFDGNCSVIKIAQMIVDRPHLSGPTQDAAEDTLTHRDQYAVAPAPSRSSRCLVSGDISQCGKGLPSADK